MMIRVNMYGLMTNTKIVSSVIPIFRTYDELYNGMKNAISTIKNTTEERIISFSFPITLIKEDQVRVRLFASIPTMIEDDKIRNEFLKFADRFQIKTYLILPSGESMIIRDFDKIYENLDKIEEMGIRHLKDNDKNKVETFEQFRDRMINLRDNAKTTGEVMIACTGLAYIYQLIDDFIEDHRKDLQSKMYANIKAIREEQEENAELNTELDILNKQAKLMLKHDDDYEDEFVQCIYNGEEISQNELVNRLSNHMIYKEDVKDTNQRYIGDTLDDEYRIETKKLIMTREIGGGIKIVRVK